MSAARTIPGTRRRGVEVAVAVVLVGAVVRQPRRRPLTVRLVISIRTRRRRRRRHAGLILVALGDGAELGRAVGVADRRAEVLAELEELGADGRGAGARHVVGQRERAVVRARVLTAPLLAAELVQRDDKSVVQLTGDRLRHLLRLAQHRVAPNLGLHARTHAATDI